ncbi:MAG: thioredoxin [Alphaproteobacteria bacterium]|jgi:thioredoxin 1|nr:thioredoxin [Alphaproteobacteria bacterium]
MPKEIKDADFQESVVEKSKSKPVLVDFWAAWCGPCKMIAPILEDVSRDMGDSSDIVKLNVDENPITTGNFGIRSIPTLIIFKGGVEVERIIGLSGRDEINNLLKKHI